MQVNLHGKTALVTGAGHGLGARLANALAAGGADIMGLGPDLGDDCHTALAVRALGRRFTAHRADLADRAQALAICDGIRAEGAAIDMLVVVVDPDPGAPDFCALLQTSLVVPFCLSDCVAPDMAARGAGRIVFVTPPAPREMDRPVPEQASVAGGVIALVRELSRAYGPRGVNVNAVTTGHPDNPDRASETVAAALFLASAQSAFLHGTILPLRTDFAG